MNISSGYSIRPAVEADLPTLPHIEDRAGMRFATVGLSHLAEMDGLSLDEFRAYQRAGRLWVAVASDDARQVGFAAASIIENHAHLDEIDVLPDYSGRGIGTALIETVCAWAKESGFSVITLSTQKDVAWNAPYYAKRGFVVMPPDEWTAAYRALREAEAVRGLSIDERVLMKKML
ncbi:MAG: GNAT family N-acetyltransferase [Chloroflexi bacterium]|nr:MAG: GNAT family N-acetyltransferase [Chloroflexota bacterium]